MFFWGILNSNFEDWKTGQHFLVLVCRYISPIIDVDRHVLAFFAASDGIVLENLAAQFSTEVAAVKMWCFVNERCLPWKFFKMAYVLKNTMVHGLPPIEWRFSIVMLVWGGLTLWGNFTTMMEKLWFGWDIYPHSVWPPQKVRMGFGWKFPLGIVPKMRLDRNHSRWNTRDDWDLYTLLFFLQSVTIGKINKN